MKSTAYLYFSDRFSEIIVVVNEFTSKGTMFYASAVAHALQPLAPEAIGHALKLALKASRCADKSDFELRQLWSKSQFPPLLVAAAATMDEFENAYHPVVVWIEDHAIWLRPAACATLLKPPRRFVPKDATDEVLGREVYLLWSDISNLVCQ